MEDAKGLWRWWQSLLGAFEDVFTRPGWVRFVQWVTGMVLCSEEHTITQILTSLGLESRWRVLEHLAEYGAWDRGAVERVLMRLIERERPSCWGRYCVQALDDTKLHRSSAGIWGTCTFHEYTARSPNRAETVRAHNWVVLAELVPGKPWTYLPHAARLYLRESQRPRGERFQRKTQLAVELFRQARQESKRPILGVFDGAYALSPVVRGCITPADGGRRTEILTRLRRDARLYRELTAKPGAMGRPRKWGRRLPAPEHHERWGVGWHKGQAWVYGRRRKIRWKRLECRWAVSGPEVPVHAYVFEVEGYAEPWFLVTTALDLSGEQVVEAFTARFRQEDGFRDHKQRLGMEECRAWTKEPVLRTFQVQLVAQALLRLLELRLDQHCGVGTWWRKPEWNRRKARASLLDLRRLLWRHRDDFSKFLVVLEEIEKVAGASTTRPKRRQKAA